MMWEVSDVMGYSQPKFLRFLYLEFGRDTFTTRDVIERIASYGLPVTRSDRLRIALLLNLLNRGRYLYSKRIDGYRKSYWISKRGIYKLRHKNLI